jgi:hypothetical protein
MQPVMHHMQDSEPLITAALAASAFPIKAVHVPLEVCQSPKCAAAAAVVAAAAVHTVIHAATWCLFAHLLIARTTSETPCPRTRAERSCRGAEQVPILFLHGLPAFVYDELQRQSCYLC